MTPEKIADTVTSAAIRVRISLNARTTPPQAMEAVDAICTALSRQEASAQHLRILLGHALAAIQDRRLFEPSFATFEEFTLDVATKHRLSRTTVRESLMIARNLPTLAPRQAEEMPMVNMALAARAAKKAEPKDMRVILRYAAEKSVIEFRRKMEDRGLIAHRGGRTADSVTLHIKVPAAVADRWREIAASADPGEVLAELIMPRRAIRKAA